MRLPCNNMLFPDTVAVDKIYTVSLKLTPRWSLDRCTGAERSVRSANSWDSDIQWILERVYCTTSSLTVCDKWQKSNLGTLMNRLPKDGQCRLSNLEQRSVRHRMGFTQESSASESEYLYDWRFTPNQFVLATSPLRLTTIIFIFQLHTCGYSPYVTSSLTRWWVCRLQLLLVLVSTVILRSESCGTHEHILQYQIRDSPKLESQAPAFTSPRKSVARLYPQALGVPLCPASYGAIYNTT
jgi:hypothetical protein